MSSYLSIKKVSENTSNMNNPAGKRKLHNEQIDEQEEDYHYYYSSGAGEAEEGEGEEGYGNGDRDGY
jgi:hypothetical protein